MTAHLASINFLSLAPARSWVTETETEIEPVRDRRKIGPEKANDTRRAGEKKTGCRVALRCAVYERRRAQTEIAQHALRRVVPARAILSLPARPPSAPSASLFRRSPSRSSRHHFQLPFHLLSSPSFFLSFRLPLAVHGALSNLGINYRPRVQRRPLFHACVSSGERRTHTHGRILPRHSTLLLFLHDLVSN